MPEAAILVVDDDAPIRRMLDRTLSAEGYAVETAADVTTPMQVRTARQSWEYETVGIPAGSDVAALLNARGVAGWEAVGTASVTTERITILLKRPR